MTNIIQLNKDDLRAELSLLFSDMVRAAQKQAETKAENLLLTPEQACESLKVSSVTLWRWAKTKYLPPVYIGGQKRYRLKDIEAIIDKKGGEDGK
jgi:predicted DNA-binding transcriptional regulator AlpA